VEFAASLSEVMFKYTHYVMYLAPLGVAGAMAATVAQNGPTVSPATRKAGGGSYGVQLLSSSRFCCPRPC